MSEKIEFVVVGPMKTGTSWIYEYLKTHPEFCVSDKVKESFYFDYNYSNGVDWYHELFVNKPKEKIRGEVGPTYFSSLEAIHNIYSYNPKAKILITLREPIGRIVSNYRHGSMRGAIDSKGNSLKSILEEGSHPVFERSRYLKYLDRWVKKFGKENVLVLLYEDLSDDPDVFVDKMCHFAGAQSYPVLDSLRRRVLPGSVARSVFIVSLLKKVYRMLQRLGLYKLASLPSKFGLKRLLFSSKGSAYKVEGFTNQTAFHSLKGDLIGIEKYGVRLDKWQKIWRERYGLNDKEIEFYQD